MKNVVHIFTFLSAMGLMTACTQDDMTDNTLLPEGSCPLGLNVSITDNSAATRATPDGTWKGDGTESVTVGVSFDPLTKPTPYRYTVTGTDLPRIRIIGGIRTTISLCGHGILMPRA